MGQGESCVEHLAEDRTEEGQEPRKKDRSVEKVGRNSHQHVYMVPHAGQIRRQSILLQDRKGRQPSPLRRNKTQRRQKVAKIYQLSQNWFGVAL